MYPLSIRYRPPTDPRRGGWRSRFHVVYERLARSTKIHRGREIHGKFRSLLYQERQGDICDVSWAQVAL